MQNQVANEMGIRSKKHSPGSHGWVKLPSCHYPPKIYRSMGPEQAAEARKVCCAGFFGQLSANSTQLELPVFEVFFGILA